MIKFEAKIIIGSLIGILTTSITLINIFFPSIFNTEYKSINNFKIILSNNKSLDNLYRYLFDHQDEYVHLTIEYEEISRKIAYVIDKNIIEKRDFPIKIGVNEKNCIGYIGNNSYVFSYADSQQNLTTFNRQFGNFQFSIIVNDKIVPFILIIPYPSRSNLVYEWKLIDDSKNKMILTGYFYIHKFTDKYVNNKIDILNPKSYFNNVNKQYIYENTIFCEIEPITKDIFINNFK